MYSLIIVVKVAKVKHNATPATRVLLIEYGWAGEWMSLAGEAIFLSWGSKTVGNQMLLDFQI